MEMSSAKILDEACNHYNEVYRDEFLYAECAEGELPGLEPGFSAPAPVHAAPPRAGRAGFTSRLYTRRE